jgi:Zn-dependent peptidase ImmA (M78 family)/transcriptional regulator with XRE-family HTH domain
MDAALIRIRLKALREHHDLSQADLAQQLGLKDRQTLSDIELGDRKITAQELVNAAQIFGMSVGHLTDPLRLVGEGQFSWRQKNTVPVELDAFENKAGQWIATYRYLSRLKGEPVNSVLRRVALNEKSTFEDAQAEGEAIAQALELGEVPALKLASVVEDQLDTLVLHVDAVKGVSGAACQLDQLNTILINRHEPAARRAFDMAHELFHLLTWDRMEPKHIEGDHPTDKREKRVEQLADNFAAGLLMPSSTIAQLVAVAPLPDEAKLPTWLAKTAAQLQVSPTALVWRMVNLRLIPKTMADRILEGKAFPKQPNSKAAPPPRMSMRFVQTLGWGIAQGHISVRRAASTLHITLDDMAALFKEHNIAAPFDL